MPEASRHSIAENEATAVGQWCKMQTKILKTTAAEVGKPSSIIVFANGVTPRHHMLHVPVAAAARQAHLAHFWVTGGRGDSYRLATHSAIRRALLPGTEAKPHQRDTPTRGGTPIPGLLGGAQYRDQNSMGGHMDLHCSPWGPSLGADASGLVSGVFAGHERRERSPKWLWSVRGAPNVQAVVGSDLPPTAEPSRQLELTKIVKLAVLWVCSYLPEVHAELL
jgi:hypothetical protein